MAEQHKCEVNGTGGVDSTESTSYLEDFIASQMQQQEKTSKEADNLDTAKRDSFIARALSESRRMSMEVEKSRKKRENLESELGGVKITQWKTEHSSEVMQTQQTNLPSLSFQHG